MCDLDSPEYFERDDLVTAVEGRLVGDPGAPAGSRADQRLARTVALAAAERAKTSFLVAWAADRRLAQQQEVIDTTEPNWRQQLPSDPEQAMAGESSPGASPGMSSCAGWRWIC